MLSCISQDIQSEDAHESNLFRGKPFWQNWSTRTNRSNAVFCSNLIEHFLFSAFVATYCWYIFVASFCSFIDIFYCYSYERWGEVCTAVIPPPCIECNSTIMLLIIMMMRFNHFNVWHTMVSLINRISVKSYPDICRVLSLEAPATAKSALLETCWWQGFTIRVICFEIEFSLELNQMFKIKMDAMSCSILLELSKGLLDLSFTRMHVNVFNISL